MARLVRAQLVGTWELERWEIEHGAGERRSLPFGADARGLLIYTEDGGMSATIMAGGRKAFTVPNPRDAAERERAAAFDSYFSYAGRYRIVGAEVHHQIAVAMNPAMVGTLQARQARIDGTRLELLAEETLPDGRSRRHVLAWRRTAEQSA